MRQVQARNHIHKHFVHVLFILAAFYAVRVQVDQLWKLILKLPCRQTSRLLFAG